jgi:hypothetical protein
MVVTCDKHKVDDGCVLHFSLKTRMKMTSSETWAWLVGQY